MVLLWQSFEDYRHDVLDDSLIFEGLKDSVTLIAFWLNCTVCRMSQSPFPPLLMLL